ncbi:Benomyl/methotrexate resistance [Pseudohyphozyma bogoriensis]|nr:Benomyl/methotrexate resistance [Pseudohyphozyma bogoriensis]
MSALIRETPFGKLVHFLARGKILKYPEEVDGFVVPASMLSRPVPEKQQSQQSHDENETETVVGSDAGGAGSPGAAEKGMNFGAGDKPPKRPQPSRHESMASAAEIGEVLQQSLSRQLTRHGEVARAKCDPMSAETIIVTWYGDDDPDNPQNWSHWKKSLVTFTICGRNPFYWAPMIAFCGFQAGLCRVQTYTGVVLLRMLTAFCGGPVLSTGGATLADIYNPFQIPTGK